MGMLHFAEKFLTEILLTAVKWTVAIRQSKEHLAGTGTPFRGPKRILQATKGAYAEIYWAKWSDKKV